ncbi:hypothetical protein ACKVMT_02395 [Halobacteriales archaeon Cl-PHB]
MTQDVLPRLEPGLTHLRSPDPRSTALHRLVVNERRDRKGSVYWLDARNVAATYALYELAPHHRRLDAVRVARAFTAYQHHSLAREIVRTVSPRTAMVVAPNLGSLYEDDDVPDYEQDDLYAATATLLGEVGTTHDLPVLVTTDASNAALPPAVADDVTAIECEQTRMGLRYAAEDFETTVYVEDGHWQTTIPYWVDLFGAVDTARRAAHPDPAEPDLGPLEIAASGQ